MKKNQTIMFCKKVILSYVLALTLLAGSFMMGNIEVKAAWEEAEMDVSYLTLDGSLFGYAERQTRGLYLAEGWSSINDAGIWTIGCGGITNAAQRCTVSITSIVERKLDGNWVHVKSWTSTEENSLTASVSKYLAIVPGYYYRVRSTHYAESDVSTSCTSSLWK